LAFQYGANGLAKHHKAFADAVLKRDWKTAAKDCPSGVAQPERTEFRRSKLLEALAAAPMKTSGTSFPPPNAGERKTLP